MLPPGNNQTGESSSPVPVVKSQFNQSDLTMPLDRGQSTVKMIIYTDFQCGACERFHSQVEPKLIARYVDTGKVQIETHIVGALGEDSMRAAEATMCAADQGLGLFDEYLTALFIAWRELDGEAYGEEQLVELAETIGLNKEALEQCLESGGKRLDIERNLDMAKADGVHTLPAVVIGSVSVQGYKPLTVYTGVIERALADRLPR